MNSFNYFKLKYTEFAIKNKLTDLLSEFRGFKFETIFVLEFKKIESCDQTNYSAFYSNSKAWAIINESDINVVFESIYITIT